MLIKCVDMLITADVMLISIIVVITPVMVSLMSACMAPGICIDLRYLCV